jgi:hypothetical protein
MSLKRFVPKNSKPGEPNGGVPRSLPRKSFVTRAKPQVPTILGKKVKVTSTKQALDSNTDDLTSMEKVKALKLSYVGNVSLTRPKNPFIEEKITKHPVFGNASLELEVKKPASRFSAKRSLFDKKMNIARMKDMTVNHGDLVSNPGFASTK